MSAHQARPRRVRWGRVALVLLLVGAGAGLHRVGLDRVLRALGARGDAWMTVRWKAEQQAYRQRAPLVIHHGAPRDARLEALFADPRVQRRAARCVWLRLPREPGGPDWLEVRSWDDPSRVVAGPRPTDGLDVTAMLLLLDEGLGPSHERR